MYHSTNGLSDKIKNFSEQQFNKRDQTRYKISNDITKFALPLLIQGVNSYPAIAITEKHGYVPGYTNGAGSCIYTFDYRLHSSNNYILVQGKLLEKKQLPKNLGYTCKKDHNMYWPAIVYTRSVGPRFGRASGEWSFVSERYREVCYDDFSHQFIELY